MSDRDLQPGQRIRLTLKNSSFRYLGTVERYGMRRQLIRVLVDHYEGGVPLDADSRFRVHKPNILSWAPVL